MSQEHPSSFNKADRERRQRRQDLLLCFAPVFVVGFAFLLPAAIRALAPVGVNEIDTSTEAAASEESVLAGEINQFKLDCGRYPTTAEGFGALQTSPPAVQKKWKGPYSQRTIHNDPRGHPYVYQFPGDDGPNSFSITSYGRSGQPGPDNVIDEE